MRRAVAALVLMAAAACAPAPAAADDLPTLLADWQRSTATTGVTMAVLRPGHAPWAGAAGVRDRETGVPVRPDDPFAVGSVTKTFVATVVLQLAEEGGLALDDPLDRHLDGYPHTAGVTIRHLLTHTSGIPDYVQAHGFTRRLVEERDKRWTAPELLGLIGDRERVFPPGTAYDYSNTNYVLLGEVVSAVSGRPWSTEVRRRIIDPLGLRSTSIAGAEPVSGGLVSGYFDVDNDGVTENVDAARWPANSTAEGAAGALVSTAPDLARFAQALFGGELLGEESLAAMVTRNPYGAPHTGYGLGVEIIQPDYETTVWGHGGTVIGFRARMMYLPGSRVAIVVLVNEVTANPLDLGELAMRAVLRGDT